MIIPQLNFDQLVDSSGELAVDVIERLSHWSLFGKLALTQIPATGVTPLVKVIERIGGRVDLIVSLLDFAEADAITLLNAGAATLVCSEPERAALATIPDDRTLLCQNDDAPDEAVPRGCVVDLTPPASGTGADRQSLAARGAELEMARVDCLVNVERLTPELLLDFFKTVLVTDRPDGLWATLIVDPIGTALGLAFSNEESLLYALEQRVGSYWSRSRNELWVKGETSGATQRLLGLRMDCDRDCLRFQVTQDPPGFCHRDTHTCFGAERTIESVIQRLLQRLGDDDEHSFTKKLAQDPEMLKKKLLEEAEELSEASQTEDLHEIAWEAADLLYFSLVATLKNGVAMDRVFHELSRRMNRVVRRKNKLENEPGEA